MRRQDWLIGQLPVGLLEDDFFRRFATMFQDMGSTVLDHVDGLEHALESTVAPLPMVRFLGSWLDLQPIDPDLDEELQRRIVRGAGAAVQYRGTARGLTSYLELLTGAEVHVTDSGGIHRAGQAPHDPGHVDIQVASTGGWLRDEDLLALVRDEVPAHVRFRLTVAGRQLWPLPGEAP